MATTTTILTLTPPGQPPVDPDPAEGHERPGHVDRDGLSQV